MTAPPTRNSDTPDFTPVALRRRADGWTAERQSAFIAALRSRPCIDAAARAVGMSRESAYRLRRRAGAESFAAAWDAAFAAVPRGMTSPSLLWHRACYGSARPAVRDGTPVEDDVRLDNRTLLTRLRRLDRLSLEHELAEGHSEIFRSNAVTS